MRPSVKVKMLVATHFEGNRLTPGDTTTVLDTVAERWAKAGIAEKQTSKPTKKTDTEKE